MFFYLWQWLVYCAVCRVVPTTPLFDRIIQKTKPRFLWMKCKNFLDKTGKMSPNETHFLLWVKVGQLCVLSNEPAGWFLYNKRCCNIKNESICISVWYMVLWKQRGYTNQRRLSGYTYRMSADFGSGLQSKSLCKADSGHSASVCASDVKNGRKLPRSSGAHSAHRLKIDQGGGHYAHRLLVSLGGKSHRWGSLLAGAVARLPLITRRIIITTGMAGGYD